MQVTTDLQAARAALFLAKCEFSRQALDTMCGTGDADDCQRALDMVTKARAEVRHAVVAYATHMAALVVERYAAEG